MTMFSIKEKEILENLVNKYSSIKKILPVLKSQYKLIFTKFKAYRKQHRNNYISLKHLVYHLLDKPMAYCLQCGKASHWNDRLGLYDDYCSISCSHKHLKELEIKYSSNCYIIPSDKELIYLQDLLNKIKEDYGRYLQLPLLRFLDKTNPYLAELICNLPGKHYSERLHIMLGDLPIKYCDTCGKVIVYKGSTKDTRKYCSNICNQTTHTVEVNDKRRQTCLDRYGVEYAVASKQVQEKTKQTNIKKYGVDRPSKNKQVQEKTKQTNIKKYGVPYTFQAESVKEKIKQTNIKRYGVENVNQSIEIQNKRKETCLKRYGVEHPHQHAESLERFSRTCFEQKLYTLGDREVLVQGYEPQALDYLLNKYKSEDIQCGFSNVPLIFYKQEYSNKVYYPDIFIPRKNLVIEVKSLYTLLKDKATFKVCKNKAKASMKAGFKFKLLVMYEDGSKQKIPKDWYNYSFKELKTILNYRLN